MDPSSGIVIFGRSKMYGMALESYLRSLGYANILSEPDYTNDVEVDHFFEFEHPQYVFVVGGLSGGIRANQTFPVKLMRDNLALVNNVIPAAPHGRRRKITVPRIIVRVSPRLFATNG